MRKLASTLLAVPVIVGVYAAHLVRRAATAVRGLAARLVVTVSAPAERAAGSPRDRFRILAMRLGWGRPEGEPGAPRRPAGSRVMSVVVVAGLAGIVVLGGARPEPSAARPITDARSIAAELLAPVRTGHPLRGAFEISFSAPMEPASVTSALRLDPPTPAALAWNQERTLLSISPLGHWEPATLYAITIEPGASGLDGTPLGAAVRALVLTQPAGSATIAATGIAGDRVLPETAVRIVLDRPVPLEALRAALRVEPLTAGEVVPGRGEGEYLLRFATPLLPDADYAVRLTGLVDADGVAFAAAPELRFRTVAAPSVVRFRPRPGTTGIATDAVLSVRFTQAMDRTATAAAFTVAVGATMLTGKVSWAEDDTVLVFDPDRALPYEAKVVMRVGAGARSAAGLPITRPAASSFIVVRKAAPISRPPGAGAVAATWYAVEVYYLRLMNCTRTGGLVTSDGACSSPGGRDVAPLSLSAAISDRVARPYARLLATRGLCSHYADGTLLTRMNRAGFVGGYMAENLGCRSGNPFSAVLGSHLYFQSERSWSPQGGHYVNLMNSRYTRVGIGVWVHDGRVRLAVNFYDR